jgi:hypothetical protein
MHHAIGHFPGFKAQGPAPSGEFLVPGDEKMFASEAVNFLWFHESIRKSQQAKAKARRLKKSVFMYSGVKAII